MLSFTQKKNILDYFKDAGYSVVEVSDNIIDISKDKANFYLQLHLEDEIKVLRVIVKTDDFSFEYNDYFPLVKLYVKFQPNYEINIQYQYPFLGFDLDLEQFKISPITSLITDLLSQLPVSAELIKDVRQITRELDQLLKEGE